MINTRILPALLLTIILGCSQEKKIENECGSPIMWFTPPKPAKFGYYNLVLPTLKKFKNEYGAYPECLDSLTKLDSVSYSHMEQAWDLKYAAIDNGKTFSMDGYSEAQLDSLEMEKMADMKRFKEFNRKWDECKERIVGSKK